MNGYGGGSSIPWGDSWHNHMSEESVTSVYQFEHLESVTLFFTIERTGIGTPCSSCVPIMPFPTKDGTMSEGVWSHPLRGRCGFGD